MSQRDLAGVGGSFTIGAGRSNSSLRVATGNFITEVLANVTNNRLIHLPDETVTLGSSNSLVADNVTSVDNKTSLRALTPANNDFVSVASPPTLFRFSTANLSAQVTADPAGAIHVAPNSDPTGASGAWILIWDQINLQLDWFGADPTGVADSTVAIQRWIDYAIHSPTYAPRFRLIAGVGTYLITSKIRIVAKSLHILGCGSATIFKWTTVDTSNSGTACVFEMHGYFCQIEKITLDIQARLSHGFRLIKDVAYPFISSACTLQDVTVLGNNNVDYGFVIVGYTDLITYSRSVNNEYNLYVGCKGYDCREATFLQSNNSQTHNNLYINCESYRSKYAMFGINLPGDYKIIGGYGEAHTVADFFLGPSQANPICIFNWTSRNSERLTSSGGAENTRMCTAIKGCNFVSNTGTSPVIDLAKPGILNIQSNYFDPGSNTLVTYGGFDVAGAAFIHLGNIYRSTAATPNLNIASIPGFCLSNIVFNNFGTMFPINNTLHLSATNTADFNVDQVQVTFLEAVDFQPETLVYAPPPTTITQDRTLSSSDNCTLIQANGTQPLYVRIPNTSSIPSGQFEVEVVNLSSSPLILLPEGVNLNGSTDPLEVPQYSRVKLAKRSSTWIATQAVRPISASSSIAAYLLSKMIRIPVSQRNLFLSAIASAASGQAYSQYDVIDTLSLIHFCPVRAGDDNTFQVNAYDNPNVAAGVNDTVRHIESWNSTSRIFGESSPSFPTLTASDGLRFSSQRLSNLTGNASGVEMIWVAKIDADPPSVNRTLMHQQGQIYTDGLVEVAFGGLPANFLYHNPTASMTSYRIFDFFYSGSNHGFQIDNETLRTNTVSYSSYFNTNIGGGNALMNVVFVGLLTGGNLTNTQRTQIKRVLSFFFGLGLY